MSPILELSANQRPLSHVNSPCNTIPVFTFKFSLRSVIRWPSYPYKPYMYTRHSQLLGCFWGAATASKCSKAMGAKGERELDLSSGKPSSNHALLYKTLQFHTIPCINKQMVRWCSLQWWCAKMSRGITTVSVSSRYWYDNRYWRTTVCIGHSFLQSGSVLNLYSTNTTQLFGCNFQYTP